jgi:uncharacterized protein (TIGR00255 family)
MIRSMSGYGRGIADGEGLRIVFELRSVNHRFCRVGTHLPNELMFFESTARQLVSERVERGKVDLAGTVRGPGGLQDVQINHELAAAYKRSLAGLAAELEIEPRVDLALLATLPGVLAGQNTPQVDPERDAPLAEQALAAALDALDEMRAAEGEHLAADMTQRFTVISGMVARVQDMTVGLPQRYRDLLTARIETLLDESAGEIDPARLAQEVAHYADRSDITEELVRLRSHLDKAAALLDNGGAVGRTLEFLLQEMHREINTVGAKAKAVEIGDLVVDLKSELERVREQVQNVE